MPDFDRELLEAWDDPEVPQGFADRVMARAEAPAAEPPATPGPTPWSVWAAVAALVVVGATILLVPGTPPVPVQPESVTPMAVLSGAAMGSPPPIQCTGPDEVDFADRGRATLKDSAVLEWTVDEEARLKVHQRQGRVRYDLPVGETVLLTTPNAAEAMELEGRFEVDLEVGEDAAINAY